MQKLLIVCTSACNTLYIAPHYYINVFVRTYVGAYMIMSMCIMVDTTEHVHVAERVFFVHTITRMIYETKTNKIRRLA